MSNTGTEAFPRTDSEVPSSPYRFIEWFVFASLVLLALPTTFMAVSPSLTLLLAVPALLFVPLSFVVTPVLVYWDATLVRSIDAEWTPSAARCALVAFLLSPLMFAFSPVANEIDGLVQSIITTYLNRTTVGIHQQLLQLGPPIGALYYLYRRHEHVPVSRTTRFWWVLLPITSLGGLGYLAAVLLLPNDIVLIPSVVALLRLLFPVAAYMDALFLQNSRYSWDPNPATHFLLAYVSILVFPLSFLYLPYTGYHLGRRWYTRPS